MSRTARTKKPPAARNTPAATASTFPGWVAPVAYVVAVILLFREFIFTGAPLLGTDTFALSWFARDFYTQYVNEMHRMPEWNPLLFGGLPFIEGMHGDISYPVSLALFFLDARTMWGWKMVLHVYAAGLFAYLFLRGIGLRRGPAFFGGLVYMMGADLVSLVYPGGDGKLFVSALAPLVFWLADRCARYRRIGDFALFALGIALVVFTSHMQLAYFCVWGVSLYFFFRVWQGARAEKSGGRAVKLVGAYAVAGVLGVAAAAVQFVPPLQYLREWSHRAGRTIEADPEAAYTYSTTYALGPEEAVSLVVPEFIGDNMRALHPQPTYWGRNFFKINHEYAGLVPLLLVPLLFLRRRSAETWFFSGLAVLSLLYALGSTTPVFRLFYLIPGVNLFRAPSLIIFLYGLSVASLGALGLQRLLDWAATGEAEASVRRTVWIVAGVFFLLALAEQAGAITGLWQSVSELDPMRAAGLQANLPNIRLGFWIAFVLAGMVALAWEASARGWFGARGAIIAFALLAALDLYRVDRSFIRGTVLEGSAILRADPTLFEPDETIRTLQQFAAEEPPFRVYDLGNLEALGTGPAYASNVFAAHGIEQLAGHHGNEMGRYRALIGGHDSAPNVAASELRLLDLANARYLVSPLRLERPGYEEVFVGDRAAVYRNTTALPRAYLVGTVEVVPDSMALQRLLLPGFDMQTTAVLPEPLPAGITIEPNPTGQVTWASREADNYTLDVETDRPALLMVVENYYPAWHVTVDGEPATLLRANYTFRAVPVPAGRHQVRFEYRSAAVRTAALVSLALLALLLAASLTAVRRPPESGEGEGQSS